MSDEEEKQKERKRVQEEAYVFWQEEKVEEWWTNLRKSDKPPTREQEAFLKCVEDRSRKEKEDLDKWQQAQRKKSSSKGTAMSEPLRACLFGIPCVGKSTCIKHLRSFSMKLADGKMV